MVENLSRDKPLNKQDLVISSGYAVKTAEGHAPDIMEQKGVLEALDDYGFNVETAKKVVGQILLEGENDNVKLKAGEMIFKVHGTFAPEKSVNLNINHNTNNQAIEAAEKAYLANLDGTPGTTES